MFEVKNGVISLTKGESASLFVGIFNSDGSKRALVSGDAINLELSADADTSNKFATFPGTIVTGEYTSEIKISAANSAQLPVGKYSCRIWFKGKNGDEAMIFPDGDLARSKIDEVGNWKNFWVLPWR